MAKQEHTAHFGAFEDPLEALMGFSQKDRSNTVEIDLRTTMDVSGESDSSILQKRVKIETITESGQNPDFEQNDEDNNCHATLQKPESTHKIKRKKTKQDKELKAEYQRALKDRGYVKQKSYLYDDLDEKDDLDSSDGSGDDSGSDTFGLDRDDTHYQSRLGEMGIDRDEDEGGENGDAEEDEADSFDDEREREDTPYELGHLGTSDMSGTGEFSSSTSPGFQRAITTGHVKEKTGEFGLGDNSNQFAIPEEDEGDGIQRFDSGVSGIGIDREDSGFGYGINFETQMSGLTIASNDVLERSNTDEKFGRSDTINQVENDPSVKADMLNMSRKMEEVDYEDRSDIDSLDSGSSDDSITRSNTVFNTNHNFAAKQEPTPKALFDTAQIKEIKNRYSAVNHRRNCQIISQEDTANEILTSDDPSLSKIDILRAHLQNELSVPLFTKAYHIIKHLTLEDLECTYSTFTAELKDILNEEQLEKQLPFIQTLIYMEEMQ
eukprot:CAMPEP_0115015258 /NCGR_PEP_ID=MMETSP0216-20121206/26646_1 /TAXON_ID=223996 /ORGANISM="Protocruzia adherens, Strain Boccale" /LENGTH=492 /DNA_ID=CAMNT_0002385313 /DNA_START=1696 /DNA_END=3174 /DNA_ORIENTATION=-